MNSRLRRGDSINSNRCSVVFNITIPSETTDDETKFLQWYECFGLIFKVILYLKFKKKCFLAKTLRIIENSHASLVIITHCRSNESLYYKVTLKVCFLLLSL